MAQVPNKLDPSSNPLLFPTKPEEITIQKTVPITLEQALELAIRNNNDRKVSLLQVERSQEALKEAQASLFPSVNISTSLSYGQNATNTLLQQQTILNTAFGNNLPNTTTFNTQVQLSYDLYTSGKRTATNEQAEYQLWFDKLGIKSSSIRLNVKLYY
jgi:OMF family outer membrane factor